MSLVCFGIWGWVLFGAASAIGLTVLASEDSTGGEYADMLRGTHGTTRKKDLRKKRSHSKVSAPSVETTDRSGVSPASVEKKLPHREWFSLPYRTKYFAVENGSRNWCVKTERDRSVYVEAVDGTINVGITPDGTVKNAGPRTTETVDSSDDRRINPYDLEICPRKLSLLKETDPAKGVGYKWETQKPAPEPKPSISFMPDMPEAPNSYTTPTSKPTNSYTPVKFFATRSIKGFKWKLQKDGGLFLEDSTSPKDPTLRLNAKPCKGSTMKKKVKIITFTPFTEVGYGPQKNDFPRNVAQRQEAKKAGWLMSKLLAAKRVLTRA